MMQVFNTPFELSLRAILLLSVVTRNDMSLSRITNYDFMATYGTYFNLSEKNLHGSNDYSFSELTSRRELFSIALKLLVIDGLVKATYTNSGFFYEITEAGRAFCDKQSTIYAKEYKEIIFKVDQNFGDNTEVDLLTTISKKSKASLRR